jgi:hypothetical protein
MESTVVADSIAAVRRASFLVMRMAPCLILSMFVTSHRESPREVLMSGDEQRRFCDTARAFHE